MEIIAQILGVLLFIALLFGALYIVARFGRGTLAGKLKELFIKVGLVKENGKTV